MAPSPGDVDATLATILQAAAPMEEADAALQAFGSALEAAADQAGAGAPPEGSLGDALSTFASDARNRANERAAECGELAEAMRESVSRYQESDGNVGLSFGGVG